MLCQCTVLVLASRVRQQVDRVAQAEEEYVLSTAVGMWSFCLLRINFLNPLLEAGTCSLVSKKLSKTHSSEIVPGELGECPFLSACIY